MKSLHFSYTTTKSKHGLCQYIADPLTSCKYAPGAGGIYSGTRPHCNDCSGVFACYRLQANTKCRDASLRERIFLCESDTEDSVKAYIYLNNGNHNCTVVLVAMLTCLLTG
ncbi:unnamed protein product [Clavelina lepadiformis]|uniref:Uncharacterized protein n=1 Tax=Clavelina lepadiformis TaxID=159417 RepID=A0ABP0GCH4_CLALP